MKVILTEGQYMRLIDARDRNNNNVKPSHVFDMVYGTNVSYKWKFPFGLTEDEAWKTSYGCQLSNHKNGIYGGDEYFRTSSVCEKYHTILNHLTEEYFPYPGVKDLSLNVKRDILMGMCSRYNIDDIIWFSITGVHGNDSRQRVNRLEKEYFPEQSMGLGWVLSPPTMNKILKQLHYI